MLSFILPEKKAKMREKDIRFGEAQIRKMLDAQMAEVRNRISDVVEETAAYAVEKAERSMERISNEKIMAVSEYSDTVLEAIHKNHEEAVFLYDMLNDKQQGLKDAAAEAENTARNVLREIRDAAADARIKAESMQQSPAEESMSYAAVPAPVSAPVPAPVSAPVPALPVPVTGIEVVRAGKQGVARLPVRAEETVDRPTAIQETPAVPVPETPAEMSMVAISFADTEEDGKNNNEKILSLHRAGKSNVAIAKELGLGVGEVKLVIDLFKEV